MGGGRGEGDGVKVGAYSSLRGRGREEWSSIRGWALIYLIFSAFKIGAYSRWALNRGWALIRINTIYAL